MTSPKTKVNEFEVVLFKEEAAEAENGWPALQREGEK